MLGPMSARFLSTVAPSAQCTFRPDALSRREQHAVVVARIISIWAHVEHVLGVLLGHMAGAHAHRAMKEYAVATGFKRQKDLLDRWAPKALSEDRYELYRALLQALTSTAQERHAFAHHIWGISDCPKLADAVLLLDPRKDLERIGHVFHNEIHGVRTPEEAYDALVYDPRLIRVYLVKDLEKIRQEVATAFITVNKFITLCYSPYLTLFDECGKLKLYYSLCSSTYIRRYLNQPR